MKDMRDMKLTELLVNYSRRLKKEESCLIDVTDVSLGVHRKPCGGGSCSQIS